MQTAILAKAKSVVAESCILTFKCKYSDYNLPTDTLRCCRKKAIAADACLVDDEHGALPIIF